MAALRHQGRPLSLNKTGLPFSIGSVRGEDAAPAGAAGVISGALIP
jgi:hypothetical protein